MTPESRYELLAIADSTDLEALADRILGDGAQVSVVSGPEPVSAAMRYPVPGTDDSTTVVGHVALTTCTVELDGVRGDGIRTGRALTAAVAAAVCDAEVARNGPLADAVMLLCGEAAELRAAEAQRRAHLVHATRMGGDE